MSDSQFDAESQEETPLPEQWVTLPTPRQSIFSPQRGSRKKIRAWELVLHSQEIPYLIRRSGMAHRILVPEGELQRAMQEIRSYEDENRNWPPPIKPSTPLKNIYPTLFGLFIIALFHVLTQQDLSIFGHSPVEWYELGAAHSYKIRAGQWWRVVTALTLHSDEMHVLGNLVIGGTFILFVCSELGAGLGWFSILLTGVLGNLANALTRTALHLSVGASTATFGAVGIMVGLRFFEEDHSNWRRWILPLAGGVGLMAMLGTGGQRTDIGAHYLGLAAGVLLGSVIGFMRRNGALNLSTAKGGLLALAALAAPCLAWLAALTH